MRHFYGKFGFEIKESFEKKKIRLDLRDCQMQGLEENNLVL